MQDVMTDLDGEKVLRKEWLKSRVYKSQLWSPLGAHIEALASIKQGLLVPEDALAVSEADFGAPYQGFSQLVEDWNDLDGVKRGGSEAKEGYYGVLEEKVAGYFNSDLTVNVHLAALSSSGATAVEMKKELLRVAVEFRLSQFDLGFQGA